jgi:hypothetical protein
MSRQRQINIGPRGRKLRSAIAAAALPFRDLAGAIEERVLWRVGDVLRGGAEAARWPFERAAWALERRLVWPLRERLPDFEPSSRAAGAVVLAMVAITAVAVGALWSSGGKTEDGPVVNGAPVATATPTPPAESEPSGPELQGVPPKFGVEKSVGVAEPSRSDAASPTTDHSIAASDPERSLGEEGGAMTSSQKPVPAGPAAMKVARRFSEAFVFYEVGERPGRALTVFEETATPQLATALAERPPRLPASAEVPRARVLNLVPGPRRGKVYTVSASLLRVGVTSELRLKMAVREGTWMVTDVRG